jgi:MATE family multidrug resistance protein
LSAGKILVLRNVSLLFALTATTAVAARLGTPQVAAHQVGLQVWIFLALVVDALAIAGQALIGTSLGSGDGRTARTISDRLLGLGLITGVALSLALVAVAPWLGSVFTDDSAVLAAFAIVYPFLVIMQPLNALVFVWDGIAIGATAFRFLAMSTFAAAVAAVVVLLPVIPLGWGLAGVWSAIVALMLVRAASLWWWFGHAGPGIGRGPYPSSPAT